MSEPLHDPDSDEQGNDLSQYLQMYVDETEEQLEDLVETMLALEESPDNVNLLVNAFRLLHSMKGAAGMMGFDQITVLTHHLESRFERLRSGRLRLDRVTMSLTLRSIDFLRQCNQRLREGGELPTPDTLLMELHELENLAEKEAVSEEQAEALPASPLTKSTVESERVRSNVDEDLIESDLESNHCRSEEAEDEAEVNEEVSEGTEDADEVQGTYLHIAVSFAVDAVVSAEGLQRVVSRVENFGRVEATRPTLDNVNEQEMPGTLDVIVFTEAEPTKIAHGLGMPGIAMVEVRVPRDEQAAPLARVDYTIDVASVDQSPAQLSSPPAVLADSLQADETALTPSAVASSAANPDRLTTPLADKRPSNDTTSGKPVVETKTQTAETAAPRVQETMRVDIDRLDELMNLAGELIVSHAQFTQVAKDLGSELRRSSASSRARELQDSLRRVIARLRGADEQLSLGQDWNALVQELELGLDTLQQQQKILDDSRRMFGRLDEAVDNLSRVSSSLQRGVLGTRMVPIGPLFNRFKRVIRDLAVERNKEVTLILEGDQTELDKRMIDAIGDPLVHLVRNSIDHGLESTEARIAAGKPTAGTITLSAQHRGNHVYISVQDDG